MNRSSSIEREAEAAGGRFAYLLATGFGAGLAPVAPGTIGAAEGVAIFLAFAALRLDGTSLALALLTLNLALLIAGVWSSERTCKKTGVEDPRFVVIDEVSGQVIALTPVAFLPTISVAAVIAGFALFRAFDIFKPYPIRRLERLPGGYGVMADDVLAGGYAAGLLGLAHMAGLI